MAEERPASSIALLFRNIYEENLAVAPGEDPKTTGTLGLYEPLTISWDNVSLRIKSPKPDWVSRLAEPKKMREWKEEEGVELLTGMLGEVKPGEMIGIMGESGAGKSLLLKVLAGKLRNGNADGVIRVNGRKRVTQGWDRLVSHTEARDLHDAELTCKEMVQFACHIKLPPSHNDLEPLPDHLLNAVGLTHRSEVRCKHLSTGESRRLSIAVELAAQRHFLCLDEPTSGLDAAAALELTTMIRQICTKYRLSIVCVVHQPRAEVLQLFNRTILLSRGHCMYYGGLQETLDHFEEASGVPMPARENPADHLLDLISRDRFDSTSRRRSEARFQTLRRSFATIEEQKFGPARLSRQSTASRGHSIAATILFRPQIQEDHHEDTSPTPTDEWPNSNWTEFHLLLWRYSLGEIRDVKGSTTFFFLFLLLALFHGFLYFQLTLANFGGFQSRLGVCIAIIGVPITIISGFLAGQFAACREQFKAERASHTYRVHNALGAKLVSMMPLSFLTMTVFATVVYYIAGMRTDSFTYFLVWIGFTWLALLSMMLLGVILAVWHVPLLGVYCGMGFFAVCGIPVRIPDITPILSWLRFLSPAFFTLEGLIQNECRGLVFGDGITGDEYLALFGLDELSITWCAGALMITCVGYFFIALAGLHLKTQPKFIVL